MAAYYNEIDPVAAQWMRNLIAAKLIAPGDVDERSIADVRADDLRGFTQCHFFAGIGVWSYALRLAEWPDEKEIWTGSCPCQPFSDAGAGEAFDDERDLWPVWFQLVRERHPVAITGEQVASRLGLAWLDALHADLEGEAYTVGAVDTCSAGFGSPNIRQRLYWVAHAIAERRARFQKRTESPGWSMFAKRRGNRGLDDTTSSGRSRGDRTGEQEQRTREGFFAGGVADAGHPERRPRDSARDEGGRHVLRQDWQEGATQSGERGEVGRPGPTNGFWRAADWLCCTDGKWRPVRPGTFPLVTGAPGRLGRLRAYGNAINAQVAAQFIRAYMSVQP